MSIRTIEIYARHLLLLLVAVLSSSTILLYFNSEASRSLITERIRISSWTIFQAQIEAVKLSSLLTRCDEGGKCDKKQLTQRLEILASRIDILANSDEAAILPYIPTYRPRLIAILDDLVADIYHFDELNSPLDKITGRELASSFTEQMHEIDHLLQELLRDAAIYNNSIETREEALRINSPTVPFIFLALSGIGLVLLLVYQLRSREAVIERIESMTHDVTTLVNRLPLPVCVASENGQIAFLNEVGRDMFGTFATSVGSSLDRFLCGQDAPKAAGSVSLVVAEGTPRNFRYSRTALQWSGEDRFAYVFQDTRLESDEKLSAMALGKMLLLGELSSSIVHELSQPLMTISATTSNLEMLLVGRDLDEVVYSKIKRIREQVDRIGRIISNVRRLALPVQNDEEFIVIDAVKSAVSLVRFQYEQSAIQLDLSGLVDEGAAVRGNPLLIEISLANILLNSRDAYVSVGGNSTEVRTVHVSNYVIDGRVVIAVADHAGGIDPVLIDRIFDSFVTSKLQDGGMGVGLAICRRAVESMGGGIFAENRGGGACIKISLPLLGA